MAVLTTMTAFAAIVTWWIHTFIGGQRVLNPLITSEIAGFPKAVMMVCWHAITYFLGVMALGLTWASFNHHHSAHDLVLWGSIAMTLPFALGFIVVGKQRFNRWFVLPQFYLLGGISILSACSLFFFKVLDAQMVLGMGLGVVLSILAAIHVIWAFGSPWPVKTQQELVALVVGMPAGKPFPGKLATMGVGMMLGVSGCVLIYTSLLGIQTNMLNTGLWSLACVFCLRGLVGYLDTLLRPWTKSLPFRYWNRVLYSPISLMMGLTALAMVL